MSHKRGYKRNLSEMGENGDKLPIPNNKRRKKNAQNDQNYNNYMNMQNQTNAYMNEEREEHDEYEKENEYIHAEDNDDNNNNNTVTPIPPSQQIQMHSNTKPAQLQPILRNRSHHKTHTPANRFEIKSKQKDYETELQNKQKPKPALNDVKSINKAGDNDCCDYKKVFSIIESVLLIIFFSTCLYSPCTWPREFEFKLLCFLGPFFVNCGGISRQAASIGGFMLFVGGIMYFVYWFRIIGVMAADNKNRVDNSWIAYFTSSTNNHDGYNAITNEWFAETLFPSGTAILLAINSGGAFNNAHELKVVFNLLVLCITSFVGAGGYALHWHTAIKGFSDSRFIFSLGYRDISNGYLAIFCVSLIYIMLYTCASYGCKCKNTKYFRLISIVLSVSLMVSGIYCSIGYGIYAKDILDILNVYAKSDEDKAPALVESRPLFNLVYALLIGGMCTVCALDIIQQQRKKKQHNNQ